uniref:NADH dehydrogenase subunit 6 n=1 Tax=Ruditapes philippinarum TaxID=129788 RepID=Q7YF35_RUDPH|nr:NADH dehydrogenase subunit 6 [Ruditapes philippinarum]
MGCCLSSVKLVMKYGNPMFYGLWLVFVVVNVSVLLSFYGGVYGFMLFMSVVSGVLVVFSYSISLVPLVLSKKEVKKLSYTKNKSGLTVMEKFFKKYLMVLNFIISLLVLMMGSISLVFEELEKGNGSFESFLYLGDNWSCGMVIMGVFMFLVMVFCVSIAGKCKGALVK